jgi:hypothetical protein
VADPVSTPQDGRSPSPPDPQTLEVWEPEAPPAARYEQDPARLKFQEHEVEFLKLLHPAIPTPRAAKRLVNTYRLIKATLSPGELDAFIGGDGKPGEHRLVMLLLAVLIGDPTRAPAKFHATAQPRSRIHAILAPALQATVEKEVIPDDPDLRRKWLRVVARYSFQAVLEEAEVPTPPVKAKKRAGPISSTGRR